MLILRINEHNFLKKTVFVIIHNLLEANDVSVLDVDVSRGPCKPDFHFGLFHYLNWTPILKVDYSVYRIWTLNFTTDFDV